MMNGDISNVTSANFAFRLDGSIIILAESSDTNNWFFSKSTSTNLEVDDEVIRIINIIAEKTEFSVSLVIEEDFLARYSPFVRDILNTTPHTKLHIVEDQREVSKLIEKGDIDYYVDNDLRRVNQTNSEHAYTVIGISNQYLNKIKSPRRNRY